jgi:putative tryptophan/tyrosine transport system substrate-binding protein
MGADPVHLGLVASLNRPGANVTGATLLGVALDVKRLELLHEIAPSAGPFAFLINPTNAQTVGQVRAVQEAAQVIRRQILLLRASNDLEIESAFMTIGDKQARGLIIGADTFLGQCSHQIATLALRHRVPTITQSPEFAALGGLMTYTPVIADVYRQVGVYAGRILDGENPSELPVSQPTKFELIINLKTAQLLGLTVPPTLLARADEVIE